MHDIKEVKDLVFGVVTCKKRSILYPFRRDKMTRVHVYKRAGASHWHNVESGDYVMDDMHFLPLIEFPSDAIERLYCAAMAANTLRDHKERKNEAN